MAKVKWLEKTEDHDFPAAGDYLALLADSNTVKELTESLQHGTIVQHADPIALYEHPATREAARFVGQSNMLRGRIERGAVRSALGRIGLDGAEAPPEGTDVDVLLRPEQIRLVDGAGEAGARGVVVQREFHGHDVLVRVRLDTAGDGDDLILARLRGRASPPVGASVGLLAEGTAIAWPVET